DLARTLRLAGQAVRDVRGRVDLRARYDEAGPTDQLVRRASGALRGHDVALGARGVDGIWARELVVPRFEVDLARRSIALGPLRARGLEGWLRRDGTRLLLPRMPGGDDGGGVPWTLSIARADLADAMLHQIDVDYGGRPLDVALAEVHVG